MPYTGLLSSASVIGKSESAYFRHANQLQHGHLVGSYSKVAAMLDEAAEMPGVKGIMLTFDDFLAGMDE